MFTSLTGIKTNGRLHYFLNLSVNLNNPDSLIFDTRLSGRFKILEYGADDYRILNDNFVIKLMKRTIGCIVVVILTPILYCSKMFTIRSCGSDDLRRWRFLSHGLIRVHSENQLLPIRKDLHEGSTITMQLVKNAFLPIIKHGTKIEEALIVWIIENKTGIKTTDM
jgi:hypothetical protein